MSDMCEVDTNLVGPSGFKTCFHKRRLIVPPNDLKPCYGILPAWRDPSSCWMVAVPSNRILKRSSHPFYSAIHFSMVHTCYGTFLNHPVKKRFSNWMLRN